MKAVVEVAEHFGIVKIDTMRIEQLLSAYEHHYKRLNANLTT